MTRSKQTGWETVFPSVSWLRDYQRSWFRFDIVAGVTLAAYLLPAALGDASLGDIAGGDTSRFSALAAGTAVLVALIAFIAWLVKAGSIVNFISESVMV